MCGEGGGGERGSPAWRQAVWSVITSYHVIANFGVS